MHIIIVEETMLRMKNVYKYFVNIFYIFIEMVCGICAARFYVTLIEH